MLDAGELTLHILKHEDHVDWDTFVNRCTEGTFFHLSGWKNIISKVFKHKPHYLFATYKNQIVGVLPLVEQQSVLFGHTLVSTPFCVYGGVATECEHVRFFLEDKALELAHELAVDFIELRYQKKTKNPKYQRFCHHSKFITELATDDENILASIKKKQRAVVRHSLKNDLQATFNANVEECYDIYSESVRNLGTPVFDPRFFSALKQEFGDMVDILTISNNKKNLSSVLSFYYKKQVLPYYGGGLVEARHQKSNDYMYYKLMCDAKHRGCNSFDFGRSKDDSGAFKYKASWGMQSQPLHYMRALIKAKEHPNLSPNNPKYALFINCWKKLPVSISKMLGPSLSKYLG